MKIICTNSKNHTITTRNLNRCHRERKYVSIDKLMDYLNNDELIVPFYTIVSEHKFKEIIAQSPKLKKVLKWQH